MNHLLEAPTCSGAPRPETLPFRGSFLTHWGWDPSVLHIYLSLGLPKDMGPYFHPLVHFITLTECLLYAFEKLPGFIKGGNNSFICQVEGEAGEGPWGNPGAPHPPRPLSGVGAIPHLSAAPPKGLPIPEKGSLP
jgi:hypothetical protein